MLANIFISLILFPQLWAVQFNFDGFLNLGQTQNLPAGEQKAPQRIYTDYLDVKTTASSIVAVDAQTGKILYQKNPDEIRSIASITKLMTALVFLDKNPGWQKEFFTIAADRRSGNVIYLNTGEILTIRNLFYTALVASDNDAIMALVRSTGMAEDQFVGQMNSKAKEIGLINTSFADPTGLESENKASAADVAKLLNFTLQNEEIKKATSTDSYEFEVFDKVKNKTRMVHLKNTDHLLKGYLDVIGGKTGYLDEAGYCLAVKLNGVTNQEIIIVVLGSATIYDRFQDVKAVADWVFSNYKW